MKENGISFRSYKYDIPASIVVFLVALPLCLGIALASGAPAFGGIIAGIIGGIVIGSLSGSHVSVSGPAAGLTVIVLSSIERLGGYELFLTAVVLAGLIQIILGVLRAGLIGSFFPVSVIKGMLAAIGILLILKQIPHAIGYDMDYVGDVFFKQADGRNTFSEIIYALSSMQVGAIIISIISLAILITWETPRLKKYVFFNMIPGSLIVVILGIIINEYLYIGNEKLFLVNEHLVTLPVADSVGSFFNQFTTPNFKNILQTETILVAFTLAIVGSLETLLSLDAADKLDPYRRISPPSRELIAQGFGNSLSGLIGGLPITAVIVRTTANVTAGARNKLSAVLHGIFLLGSVVFLAEWLNKIPLASLAAVLLVVGFKLAKPSVFKDIFSKGYSQFLPFIITILAILFTDLLRGIVIGIVVGLFFVVRSNYHRSIFIARDNNNIMIRLQKDISFLNKAFLRKTFREIPRGSYVIIDGSRSPFIDNDIIETINDFIQSAKNREIKVELKKRKSSSNPLFRKS
jgi:MFS superfamily sulfate permease-like transporter